MCRMRRNSREKVRVARRALGSSYSVVRFRSQRPVLCRQVVVPSACRAPLETRVMVLGQLDQAIVVLWILCLEPWCQPTTFRFGYAACGCGLLHHERYKRLM